VQTFFAGNGRKYFVVTPVHERGDGGRTSSAIDRLVEALLEEAKRKDAAEDERLGIVDTDQHTVDKSPWMRRTGWLREFAGKDMAMIIKKSLRPTKDEAGLQLIWRSVGSVLDTCMDGVRDCMDRNWMLVLFWLNGADSGKAGSKPFNIDNDQALQGVLAAIHLLLYTYVGRGRRVRDSIPS
jgi:hypothetical protein